MVLVARDRELRVQMEGVEIPAQTPWACRSCQKKLGSLEYTGSNQLVGITWNIFFYKAVLSLAKSPRSDRDVCMEGGIEKTMPSHP